MISKFLKGGVLLPKPIKTGVPSQIEVNREMVKNTHTEVAIGELRMRATTIDPISDNRWDDFVMRHPESTIFHHSAWAQVLRDRYRCSPTYYVLENERGEISAAAPFFQIQSPLTGKRLACLPCSEYCFPLAYSDEDVRQLLIAAKEEVYSGRVSYLEIRGWRDLAAPEELGLKEHPSLLAHVVGLDNDADRLRSRFDHRARRGLKRAEKSQLTVRVAEGEDDVKEFHRLTTATRRRLNLLPWPYRFFQSIYRHIIVPGHGFLLLAELDGKVIAGTMYFLFKDTILYKFNASDKNYSQYRPNYLLIWNAMERACQEGYRRFDFGVSNPENQGLITFKRHWGTEEMVLPYYYYPAIHGLSSLTNTRLTRRAQTAVIKLMPEFAAKLVCEALYRHLG